MRNKVKVNNGDRFYNNVCGWYEVVKILDNQRVRVQFDETKNVVDCSKYHCVDGKVSDRENPYYHQVGERYKNKYGEYEIIEILKHKKAKVKFLETGTIIEGTIRNIKIGHIKDHFKPIILNVGYIGRRAGKDSVITKNKAYKVWYNMLKRCYDKKSFIHHPTYKDCFVCEEWKCFSTFEKWYNKNSVDNFCLDKDILFKGNKEYSPEKCCFVPNEINCLLTKRQRKRGELPIGVQYSESKKRYKASFTRGCEKGFLGYYSTPEEAFRVYKEAKEDWIKEVANKWKDKISLNVYEALMNYKVELTD